MPARNGITDFVRAHLSMSNKEIEQAAKAAGKSYNAHRIQRARWKIGHRLVDGQWVKRKSKSKGKNGRPPAAARAAPRTQTDHDVKLSQLRRLIFELGFDAAKGIFDEFDHAHQRMKSGRE